jgi:hypothetical protein
MLNRPSRSLVSSPTVPVRPASSPRASVFGENDSCSAASSTRWRVSVRTWSRPLSALDAVATDTPASFATSASVVGRARVGESAERLTMGPRSHHRQACIAL